MVRKNTFLMVLALFLATYVFATEIVILHTSNLYGTVFPYDYYRDIYEAKGLSVIDTYVKNQKKINENLLLIDTGNLFYGSPFGDFSRTLGNQPVIEAFNSIGYDVFVPGSFELNFEKNELSKVIQNLKAKTLGGNLNNIPNVQGYIVKQLKNGVKVGIVGVVVPYGNYNFSEIISSTKKAITSAKNNGANIIILATSGGITKDPVSGRQIALESNLNIGDKLVKEFSKDVDVFLFGNQALVYASTKSNKVYSLPGSEGKSVNKITVNVEKVNNAWKLKSAKIEYINFSNVAPSETFLEKFEKHEGAFENWLNESIFTSAMTVSFNKYMALIEDNVALEIVNKCIIEYTKSSAGIWNIFNPSYMGIAEGEFTRRNLYALIGKTTTVKLVKMSGKDIKNIINSSLKNVEYENSRIKFSEKLASYPWLFDIFENINYEIVVNEGKFRSISYAGKNLEDDDTILVSVPSARTYGRDPILFGNVVKDFELPVQYMVLNSLENVVNGKVLTLSEDGNRSTLVKLEYVVSPGDTLRRLSYRLAVPEEELISENKFIKDVNLIRPGWRLTYYKKYLDLIPPLKEFFEVK